MQLNFEQIKKKIRPNKLKTSQEMGILARAKKRPLNQFPQYWSLKHETCFKMIVGKNQVDLKKKLGL